jgi:hypothetical protein
MSIRLGSLAGPWVVRSTVAAVCGAVLVSGCNGGTAGGGGGDTAGGGGEGTTGGGGKGGGGEGGRKYDFGLPTGDTSVQAPPGFVYEFLQQGKCDRAQRELGRQRDGQLLSESTDLLLQAGIALCRGDVAAARTPFAATSAYGAGPWFLCELYRAAGSVIRQQPRSAFGTCPPIPPKPSLEPGQSEDPSEGPSEGPSAGPSG